MSICKKLKFATQLRNTMVLSTRLERNYSTIGRYLNLIVKEEGRILIIVDEIFVKEILESLKKMVVHFEEHLLSKKICIMECNTMIENENAFSEFKQESRSLGYKDINIIGYCMKDANMKWKVLKSIEGDAYRYFCYQHVLDLPIKDLLEFSSYYKGILFEDEEHLELYSNKKIKELKIILESLQSSVKAKKNTYDNIKELEKLNAFLTRVSKVKNLDEFLEKFLELLMGITNATSGGILGKSEDEKFEIRYKIGEICECIKKQANLKLNQDKGVEELDLEKKFMFFLNLNKFTVLYLCFDKKGSIYENKDILEIYVASARNIVNAFLEKIKNERIISQNEKLKALGEISSGIAHDFNNILATISGYVALSMVKSHDSGVKEYLEIVRRASLDGAEMLRRIQEFTKDIKEEDTYSFELDSIVKTVLNMITPKITEKCISGIEIKIIQDLKGRGHIRGREFEIREVIINILNNAIDAMPKGGKIYVRSYNLEDRIFLEIEDNGEGIPRSILPRIFDPFFSTKGVNGNGIGLSVSYKIIKDHNGNIEVESKEGVGSRFVIQLPIELEETASIACGIEMYNGYDFKILVVDDKVSVAMATGEILKSMVKEVDICFSGEEALNKLHKETYDLVISDLAMPNLNGIELGKRVKEKDPNIKFVIMTGWLGDIEEYDSNIIDALLEKPFGMEEIKEILDKLN